MFGLTYNGTIDDVRQSDDEDGEYVVESKFSMHRPGAAHGEGAHGSSSHAQPPPPPYSSPQCPERFHDHRRDQNMDHKIVSPRPQRHFQLRAPELVAAGPLRRSDTIRSMRRPMPPVSRVTPESNPLDVHQSNAESSISSVGSEPPVSPRRLDSISRRRNDDG